MSLKHFVKELNGNRVEGELITTLLYSLVSSLGILVILYFLKLRNISDFIPQYGFFIFFSVLSIALIALSARQVRAYGLFSCMPGMMIGMTTGMIGGFLIGFYVGATNGMFWGSVVGMAIGIIFGVWNGKCCGVMGSMEGIMAGFMGGLMGAMSSVMMINDNLKAASIIVYIISAVITIGLSYMIYGEMKENERELKEDHFSTIILSIVLTAAVTWFIVFGPRSVLFG